MFLNPKRVAITKGYMGVQHVIEQFKRIRNGDLEVIDVDDEFRDGDLCWIETPVNPTGESKNIQYYAEKVLIFLQRDLIGDSAYLPCGRNRFTL